MRIDASRWQRGTYSMNCLFDGVDFGDRRCSAIVKVPQPDSFCLFHLPIGRSEKVRELGDGEVLQQDQINRLFLAFKRGGQQIDFEDEWAPRGKSKRAGVFLGTTRFGAGELKPVLHGGAKGMLELDREDGWPVKAVLKVKCKLKGVTFEEGRDEVVFGVSAPPVPPVPSVPPVNPSPPAPPVVPVLPASPSLPPMIAPPPIDRSPETLPWALFCKIVDDYQKRSAGAGPCQPLRDRKAMRAFLERVAGEELPAERPPSAQEEEEDRGETTEADEFHDEQ